MAEKWMAKAFKPENKGKFTAKAKAAGKSVAQEAASVLKPGSKASTKTKRQAAAAKAARSIAAKHKREK